MSFLIIKLKREAIGMDSVKDGIALFFSFKINFVIFLSRVDTVIRNNFLKIKNIILIKKYF